MRFVLTTLCLCAALGAQQTVFERVPGKMVTFVPQREFTTLLDGRILVSGGCDLISQICREIAESEIFDPVARTYTPVASMASPRTLHNTILLPDGRVLAAGGLYRGAALQTTEIFNPVTGRWESGPRITVSRMLARLTALPDGRHLLAGGLSGIQNRFSILAAAEIYDPATNRWVTAGAMLAGRFLFAMTPLADGRVLAAGGGQGDPFAPTGRDTAEIYDPASDTWTATGRLPGPRMNHAGTLLPGGRVILTGGTTGLAPDPSTGVFDPAAGIWSAGPPLRTARTDNTSILLPSGQLLVAGGYDRDDKPMRSTEIYDAVTNVWTDGPDMNGPRAAPAALLLANGQAWLAGSLEFDQSDTSEVLRTAAPPAGQFVAVPTASYSDNSALAPDSHAAAFGLNLNASTVAANGTWPTSLDGLSLQIRDSQGSNHPAPLGLVSAGQINFLVPAGTATGRAGLTLTRGGTAVARGEVLISSLAPALFSANGSGQGAPAALVVRVRDGRQTVQPLSGKLTVGAPGEQVALVLYGSGLRGSKALTATFGGRQVPVLFSGPSPEFPGVDQVNMLLPDFHASGDYLLSVTAGQRDSNRLLVSVEKTQ